MNPDSVVLGIETSCDETSAGVIRGEYTLASLVIHSQDEHALYGGVVPELAARAHLEKIDHVVRAALEQAGVGLADLDAIGVTAGPGLIGALLVGVTWAKAVAAATGLPLIGVHHMEAHLFGVALDDAEARPPFVGLLVSGGHTLLVHATECCNLKALNIHNFEHYQTFVNFRFSIKTHLDICLINLEIF